jgi:hypothetical protein
VTTRDIWNRDINGRKNTIVNNDIVSARLDVIAAKAHILSEQYKKNQLWGGDLERGLSDILAEIDSIKREGGSNARGQWGDR